MKQLRIVAVGLALGLASASCGQVARTGRSPMILVIDKLQGASGAAPGQMGVPVLSDVVTIVKQTIAGVETPVETIYNDLGVASVRMVLKDQGAPGVTAEPTQVNAITISRYRVEYIRADGRNTPGVDVPYPFDGGVTATILEGASDVPFELVRHNAKEEAPLLGMRGLDGAIFISTIAQVTFYGKDLGGNDVQATGTISVNFANFADPK